MFRGLDPDSVVYLVLTSGLYGLIMLGLIIAQLVEFCIRPRAMRRYVVYGVAVACLVLAFDVLAVILEPNILKVQPLYVLIPFDILVAGKLVLLTMVGMYCCAATDQVDWPLVKGLLGQQDRRRTIMAWQWPLAVGLCLAWAVGMSWLLFQATSPQISQLLKNVSEVQQAQAGLSDEPSAMLVVVMVAFGFGEEVMFRLGLQNYLALRLKLGGGRYAIAVAVTSAVWALGHANMVSPEWVKLLQMFLIGLPLGYLFRYCGLEACMITHAGFNVLVLFYGTSWIRS